MRILLTTLVMALSLTNGAKAADPVEAPTDTATVQLALPPDRPLSRRS